MSFIMVGKRTESFSRIAGGGGGGGGDREAGESEAVVECD